MLGKSVPGSYAKGLGRARHLEHSPAASGTGPTAILGEAGFLSRQRLFTLASFLAGICFARFSLAQYDPPAGYYTAATGTGATLKSQLNTIIKTGQISVPYTDSNPPTYDLRTELQITDADLNDPTKLRVVYNNGVAITKNTVGSIPGWDGGNTWNREHSWPQSRGVDGEGSPDGSDMHHVFASKMTDNSTRGNLNFSGTYGVGANGTGGRGLIESNTKYYPGDADAGLIARAQFYMAVRYDGTDSGTEDLELASGNPADNGTTLGDLDRLIEWHFAKVPDTYELKRNDLIYDSYQHNRNPFIDRPEFVWSIFMGQTNDSQISIASPTTVNATTGASTKTVNLTNVIMGGTVPAAQNVTLSKAGSNGTYYSVTTAGAATSSVSGSLNAFRTNQTDSKSISVGLSTTTSTAGLRSGTVTIDNLDITAGSNGGVGHAANDANDVITVNLNVLDHATPRFASNLATSLTLDFGNVAFGDSVSPLGFGITNLTGLAGYTAALDLDSITPSGNTSAFTTNLAPFSLLTAGSTSNFTSSFIAFSIGTFTANYTLNLSDENLSGATNKSMTLTLTGKIRLAGDYNNDGAVDAGDYLVWRRTTGNTGVVAYSSADGDGNTIINDADFDVWRTHFGQMASGAGGGLTSSTVPEPGAFALAIVATGAFVIRRWR
jgi:endonuclease I